MAGRSDPTQDLQNLYHTLDTLLKLVDAKKEKKEEAAQQATIETKLLRLRDQMQKKEEQIYRQPNLSVNDRNAALREVVSAYNDDIQILARDSETQSQEAQASESAAEAAAKAKAAELQGRIIPNPSSMYPQHDTDQTIVQSTPEPNYRNYDPYFVPHRQRSHKSELTPLRPPPRQNRGPAVQESDEPQVSSSGKQPARGPVMSVFGPQYVSAQKSDRGSPTDSFPAGDINRTKTRVMARSLSSNEGVSPSGGGFTSSIRAQPMRSSQSSGGHYRTGQDQTPGSFGSGSNPSVQSRMSTPASQASHSEPRGIGRLSTGSVVRGSGAAPQHTARASYDTTEQIIDYYGDTRSHASQSLSVGRTSAHASETSSRASQALSYTTNNPESAYGGIVSPSSEMHAPGGSRSSVGSSLSFGSYGPAPTGTRPPSSEQGDGGPESPLIFAHRRVSRSSKGSRDEEPERKQHYRG